MGDARRQAVAPKCLLHPLKDILEVIEFQMVLRVTYPPASRTVERRRYRDAEAILNKSETALPKWR